MKQVNSCKAAHGKCSLQDRNFTGTVYNCALYSKGFWTLLRS